MAYRLSHKGSNFDPRVQHLAPLQLRLDQDVMYDHGLCCLFVGREAGNKLCSRRWRGDISLCGSFFTLLAIQPLLQIPDLRMSPIEFLLQFFVLFF